MAWLVLEMRNIIGASMSEPHANRVTVHLLRGCAICIYIYQG